LRKSRGGATLAGGPWEAHVILAQAFSNKLDELDRIERMIANADARRINLLREVERRRTALGARLRDASDQIIEGEVVNTPLTQPRSVRR